MRGTLGILGLDYIFTLGQFSSIPTPKSHKYKFKAILLSLFSTFSLSIHPPLKNKKLGEEEKVYKVFTQFLGIKLQQGVGSSVM